MTREADVVRSLVEMADTLVDDYDVVDLLTGLADRCVEPARRLRRRGDAGFSRGQPGAGGLLQRGDAPAGAVRAPGAGRPLPGRLPHRRARRAREPGGRVRAAGRRSPPPPCRPASGSASALPLRLREVTLGALNLLSVTRAPMDEADVIVARAFADLATLSIVQHRASAEAQRLNEQLSAALTSRVVIEQAKGVICERAGVDLAEAFSRLRAYARNHNLRLTDVAQAAIDGTLDPRGLGPASPSGALLSTRRVSVPVGGPSARHPSARARGPSRRRDLSPLACLAASAAPGVSSISPGAGSGTLVLVPATAGLRLARYWPQAGAVQLLPVTLSRRGSAGTTLPAWRGPVRGTHRVTGSCGAPRCPGSRGRRSGQGAAPVAGQGTGVVSPGGSLCSILRQASTVVNVTVSLRPWRHGQSRPDRTQVP